MALSLVDPIESIIAEWRKMNKKKKKLKVKENVEPYKSGIALAREIVRKTKKKRVPIGKRVRAKAQSEKIAWKMMSKEERKKKRRKYLESFGDMEV